MPPQAANGRRLALGEALEDLEFANFFLGFLDQDIEGPEPRVDLAVDLARELFQFEHHFAHVLGGLAALRLAGDEGRQVVVGQRLGRPADTVAQGRGRAGCRHGWPTPDPGYAPR